MKAALIVPLQDPTPFSPLSPEAGLRANLRKAKEAGFDGVELALTAPERLSPREREELHRALEETGLEVVALTTGQAYGLEGISLTEEDEELRRRALARLKAHLRFVKEELEPARTVVIIGLLRGRRGDEQARRWLREALAELADFEPEARLALEPLNRYETSLINRVGEALALLQELDRENLGLLFDTFHANIEERSLHESIVKAGGKIFHVHFADSNRRPPGWGHLDFAEVARALCMIGYGYGDRGYISLEALCQDEPGPEACLKAAEFIHRLECGAG